ncbi:MAG: DUF3313 domain-containing protein [Myxococcota bacterium]
MFLNASGAAVRGLLSLMLVLFSASLPSCRSTRGLGQAEPTGFLRDYSQLKKGERGEAQLVYINPATDFSQYDSVMIDSVTLWRSGETSGISPEDQQTLTDYLYAALHKQLSQDYEIVSNPGPGVLRVRAAVTEAKGAKVAANVVTGVVPQLRMATMAAGLATNTAKFVGQASIEGEVTDSVSGERLLAAVDQRAGTKSPGTMFTKWGDVEKSFDFWAHRLRARLAELRGE